MTNNFGHVVIYGGKNTRTYLIYSPENKTIFLDFDSDYTLTYKVKLKNPKKARVKAKKLSEKIINRFYSVKDLEKLGFKHNIPCELINLSESLKKEDK